MWSPDGSQIAYISLSGIERGRNNPSWEKLGALAHAVGVRLSELVAAAEREAG